MIARLAARCQTVRFKETTSSSTRASWAESLSNDDLETALYLPLLLPGTKKAFSLSICVGLCQIAVADFKSKTELNDKQVYFSMLLLQNCEKKQHCCEISTICCLPPKYATVMQCRFAEGGCSCFAPVGPQPCTSPATLLIGRRCKHHPCPRLYEDCRYLQVSDALGPNRTVRCL